MKTLLARQAPTKFRNWVNDQPKNTLYVSSITLGELNKGIYMLPADDLRRGDLSLKKHFIIKWFGDRVLNFDTKASLNWGAKFGDYSRGSTLTGHLKTIPAPVDCEVYPDLVDHQIAAIAAVNNLYMATTNVDDFVVTDATIFNPLTDDPADFPII